MNVPIEWAFMGANTALLTGIFYRLGGLNAGVEHLRNRIVKLEAERKQHV